MRLSEAWGCPTGEVLARADSRELTRQIAWERIKSRRASGGSTVKTGAEGKALLKAALMKKSKGGDRPKPKRERKA